MDRNVVAEAAEKISHLRRSFLRLIADLHWGCRVLISSGDRFYWDNGFSKAASLAYTTLLSLVPVTALGFSILASFVTSGEAIPQLREFIFRILRQFAPGTAAVDTVIQYLTEFSDTISSLNELAVVFLVVTSILLLNSVEYTLNEIWQVFEIRPIAHRVARFCAIIVIAPVLAISAYYTSAHFRLEPLFENMAFSGYLFNTVYNFTLPFFVDFVAFLALYYLIPKAPVRFAAATFGAFIAAILFGIAKEGFAIYVLRFSSHAAIYGTIATIPIFLFWLYLAWTIVLFGAEASYQAQYLPRTGKLWKRSVLALGDGQLLLAMQALVSIARAFRQAHKLPNDLELAERLGCSSVLLKPTLDILEKSGFIARGETRDMPLTLMRSPDKIHICDVHAALFKGRHGMHYPTEMRRVFESFSGSENAGKVSLAEIIGE